MCHGRCTGPAPQVLEPISPGTHSSFFTSSRASSMVSRAGLCCLMYCGAEDTRKPSPLLPPCTEVLGPGDGTCLSPGAKRKRGCGKGDRGRATRLPRGYRLGRGAQVPPSGYGPGAEQATSHSGCRQKQSDHFSLHSANNVQQQNKFKDPSGVPSAKSKTWESGTACFLPTNKL